MTKTNADQAMMMLEHLIRAYGQEESLVGHRLNLMRLRTLRALEHAGLIEIKTVVLVKRWVVTAAGVIWVLLRRVEPGAGLHLDRDILCGKDGYWMTRDEAIEGMMRLKRDDLAVITDLFGGAPLDPCHTQVLVYLGEGDPLQSYPRFAPVEKP